MEQLSLNMCATGFSQSLARHVARVTAFSHGGCNLQQHLPPRASATATCTLFFFSFYFPISFQVIRRCHSTGSDLLHNYVFIFWPTSFLFKRLKRLWGALMLIEWNMEYRRFAPVLIVKVSWADQPFAIFYMQISLPLSMQSQIFVFLTITSYMTTHVCFLV